MKLYTRTTVPEEYKSQRVEKLMFTVMKRFEVLIPFIVLFLLIFLFIDFKTVLWGDNSRYYFILDLSAFFSMLAVAVLFYKKPD